jgi:glucose/arabinose dehydrogenase
MRVSIASTLLLLVVAAPFASAQTGAPRAADALAGWGGDAPGVRHHIRLSDLPPPVATEPEKSSGSPVKIVARPDGALPKVPDGFSVQVFASGFKQPRTLRVAPNGDVFLSESGTGRVLVFRGGAGGMQAKTEAKPEVFAENLEKPYGMVFYPQADPRYIYIAAANQVVRYPYRNGAVKAAGPAEVIVGDIPTKRHWTRDLALSGDGKRMFVSIGSASNLGVAGMPDMTPEKIREHEKTHGRGAAWGEEANRGAVRVFDPEGKSVRNFTTGLRNCSGLALQPGTDDVWCVVNERDHLGPNLVPDFMARLQDGGFYGWPWYYIGATEDPALKGKRPDLKGQVLMPDVLFQAHSSALAVAFYDGSAFPAEYRGDAFVTLHGSHTRPERTGYKVVRVRMKGGKPAGEYVDFMTGFLTDNDTAWGRPAGVAVTRDGALLVSDDANGTIFRVTRK